MILTVDLGTSVTKAALWEPDRLVAIARSKLETRHDAGGRAEQDPAQWWGSVKQACARLRAEVEEGRGAGRSAPEVDAIAFSAARQSFVPVDAACRPLGAALLWSDRRAGAEASLLAGICGGTEELRRRTGIYLDAGSVAAKVAWLARHEPERLEGARWLLAPRDLIVWQMTGQVVTDATLASATGLYEGEGRLADDLAQGALSTDSSHLGLPGGLSSVLPTVRPSGCIAGRLLEQSARELGLGPGIPVVLGAGDRSCEVIGAGASDDRPMVSWGTTANVSVPLAERPDPIARAMIVTRAADGGWLLEGGLSAAGSLVEWIACTAGTDARELVERAGDKPAGSRGVMVMPWLGGARAPWWRVDANAAVLGLSAEHDPADIARAAVEGVAFDVARCLEAAYGGGRAPSGLVLGGAGSTASLWVQVLTGVTGLRASCRRSGEAASAGAALIAARALGIEVDLEQMNPVALELSPRAEDVEFYRALRPKVDEIAAVLIDLGTGQGV